MLVLGDAHAEVSENRSALMAAYRAADEDVALQLGDLGCYDLPTPTWFVAGNNEDFDVVESIRRGDASLTAGRPHLLAGTAVELEGLRIAGVSGTYAPTRYDASRSDLTGDRRRHFTREEIERATELEDVDVLLAHQAPHGLLRIGGRDVGCRPIDDLLAALSPDLVLVGHFHRHAEASIGGARAITLDPVWEAYYTLDPETLALSRHPGPDGDP